MSLEGMDEVRRMGRMGRIGQIGRMGRIGRIGRIGWIGWIGRGRERRGAFRRTPCAERAVMLPAVQSLRLLERRGELRIENSE